MRRPVCAVLWLAAALLFPPALHAQFDPARAYRQSEAVKSRYPDPPVAFDTPGFAPGKADFTSHEEMMAYLGALERAAPNMALRVIGHSQEGRVIPLVVLTNSGLSDPADVARLNRPVVFLQGLMHGNEPAGGEAMLAMARALALGELRPLLDRITVVIAPRCNPDGAHYFARSTPRGPDVNRDFVKADLPETRAVRQAINDYQPDVFVDAHEFSVAARWIEKFGVIQSYDLMFQYATNPNVPPVLTQMAERVYRRSVTRDIERAGYRHFWYYTTSYDMEDRRVSMGGTAPDIGRNAAGLQNMLSFLIETRGVGIGRESYGRRVHTQVVALTSVLRTTAESPADVMRVTREAKAEVARRGREPAPDDLLAVTYRSPRVKQTLAMLDPATGAPRDIEVDWDDSLTVAPVLTRPRPYAYVMPAAFDEVARRLAAAGIEVRRLRAPATLEVEAYEVTETRRSATFVEGRLRNSVTTETKPRKVAFPAGSYVYLMGQPGGNLLAAALEPESASSFVAVGMLPVDKRGTHPSVGAPSEVPVYRVPRPLALDLAPMMAPR